MNANAIHNILNVIGLILAPLIAFDWMSLGLSPQTSTMIATGVLFADKIVKLGMNIMRDGIGGLFKVQPPVQK